MKERLADKVYTKPILNADDINDILLDEGIVNEDFDIREYWDLMEDDCYKVLDLDNDWLPYCVGEEEEAMWRAALKYISDQIKEPYILVDVYRW
jgi:hypothetical protein